MPSISASLAFATGLLLPDIKSSYKARKADSAYTGGIEKIKASVLELRKESSLENAVDDLIEELDLSHKEVEEAAKNYQKELIASDSQAVNDARIANKFQNYNKIFND